MSTPGWAWGHKGHRIVALVALHYLTPEALAQVNALLKADAGSGKETLTDIASWADEYRINHGETARWHYVDIPSSEAQYDRNRNCPASKDPKWRDCVTDRILYFEGRLADTALTEKERADALKFLVHLIGDVHQPFHALGDARGGNDIPVTFMGSPQCGSRRCNLHGVWDDSMIEERGWSDDKYTDALLKKIADNHWEALSGGDPVAWTNVSHRYAQNALVRNGAMLTREYYDEEIKIVDLQLALAGLRLGHALNSILRTHVPAAAATPATNGMK